MGEFEEAEPPRQIIGAAAMGIFVFIMEIFGPLWGHWTGGPSLLWGLFPVVGVWFGAWGVLAVYVSNMMIMVVSMFMSPWFFSVHPSVFAVTGFTMMVIALIPAWAFRFFKSDPRLRTLRDGALFLLFGVVLASLASTLIQLTVWYTYWFEIIPNHALINAAGQEHFLNTLIATLFVGFPLLLLGSRKVVKARAYCRGWFS